MKILPLTIDKEIIEISDLWRKFKTAQHNSVFEEVISYRETEVVSSPSNVGQFKLKGEARSRWYMYQLLDNYIKQWGLASHHPLVKAKNIIAKARCDESHVMGVLMNSFITPTIYSDKISANFDFNKNNKFNGYCWDKQLFDEYVDEFRMFISGAKEYQKEIDVLYKYNEKMPDINYFIENGGYMVDLNFIANNLSFSQEELESIEYWEQWVQSKNHIPMSINTYDSFKNISYHSKLNSLPTSFLILAYSSEVKQFNICFQDDVDICYTQNLIEAPIIYLSKETALYDAEQFQGEYAKNFIFVGEYKKGKLVTYHLSEEMYSREKGYKDGLAQVNGMLEKFKLEEVILNAKDSKNKSESEKRFKI